jgi:GNAT superfamily N-acetyltransferase
MEQLSETKSELPVTQETLTSKQLLDEIYGNNHSEPDARFTRFNKNAGGVFKYFDLESFSRQFRADDSLIFPIVREGSQIVGIAELERNPHDRDELWIKSIDVDPSFQGKGYASRLLAAVVSVAKTEGCSLLSSVYSDEGWLKLKDKLAAIAREESVVLKDDQRRIPL